MRKDELKPVVKSAKIHESEDERTRGRGERRWEEGVRGEGEKGGWRCGKGALVWLRIVSEKARLLVSDCESTGEKKGIWFHFAWKRIHWVI